MIKGIGIIFICISISSCFSRKVENENRIFVRGDTVQVQLNYQREAESKLPPMVEYILSPEGGYMLCFTEQKGTATQPQNFIRFLVYDLGSSKTIYESSVGNGRIGWYSETQLEIFQRPGTMATGQTLDDYTRIVNIITQQTRLKSELEKDKK